MCYQAGTFFGDNEKHIHIIAFVIVAHDIRRKIFSCKIKEMPYNHSKALKLYKKNVNTLASCNIRIP